MSERVEFTLTPIRQHRPLLQGLELLAGAALMAWIWWYYTHGGGDRASLSPGRGVSPLIGVAALGVGLGLWRLSQPRDTAVKVCVDGNGITDFRLTAKPIPWTDVERIEAPRNVLRKGALVLVLRAGASTAYLGGLQRRLYVFEHGLAGGTGALRAAIARLAPDVPRFW